MNEFEIISVNISEKKGTIKKTIETALVNKLGIEGDAHAALWHRQISLLPVESIEKFSNITGRAFKYGEFAENITTKGISLRDTSILDILKIGDVVLEITQIGKLCHGNKCSIYTQVGNCIMPEEGIFCRVITPGLISVGMKGIWLPKVFRVKVITVSDRAYAGIYEDLSGPAIKNYLSSFFMDAKRKVVVDNILVPDDEEKLSKVLKDAIYDNVDFIFTTGGTGIGPRDITPEVVSKFIEKEIPGIMDSIRLKYGENLPAALISRSIAGIAQNSVIFTLPGSVKAINEYISEIKKNILHISYMIKGLDVHNI